MNPKHELVRQQRGDVLDTHWLEILIFLIGEQAEVFCENIDMVASLAQFHCLMKMS